MSAYLIADIQITDDSWVPDYAANVHDLVDKHGGRYLERSGNIKTLEGEAPDNTLIAVLEFPSMEALEAFMNDPDYEPYAKARQATDREDNPHTWRLEGAGRGGLGREIGS